jgi:23S rRNA (uridine2552-2'-O)-methyltransferase
VTRRKNPYAGADALTRRAKAQGFPARSVFKLEEIDRRVRLLRRGQRVLDLGAAPGSWSLYAAGRVGAEGRVLAVDLQAIDQPFPANVKVIQGDALALESDALRELGPYDVVLSDMAPSTSGSKVSDQARSFELFMRAVAVALELGKAGSSFVGKLFMSGDFQTARKALADRYDEVKTIRPSGTRQQSSEVFLVGLGLRPAAAVDAAPESGEGKPPTLVG